jgi:hypothetical protein
MSSAVEDVLFSLDLLPSVMWPLLDQDAKCAFMRVSVVARARADACVTVATVVSSPHRVETLKHIASLPNLKTLSMAGCVNVRSLKPLASLAELVTLNMSGCSRNPG